MYPKVFARYTRKGLSSAWSKVAHTSQQLVSSAGAIIFVAINVTFLNDPKIYQEENVKENQTRKDSKND